MRKKVKKVLGVFLATIMLTYSLAGCSGKSTPGDVAKAGTTSGSTQEQKAGTLFDKYEKPVKLVWLMCNFRGAPENNSIEKYLKEKLKDKLNIDLTINAVPLANYKEKANLLFASGEQIDFMGFNSGLGYTDFVQYAENGGLTDLTPLYNKYRSSLQWMVQSSSKNQTDTDILKYATFNDKLYGIGVYVPIGQTLTFMRKDWLTKLGYDIKDGDNITLDKFYEIAKAMKEKDPDGNGQDDTTAMISSQLPNDTAVSSILGAFGCSIESYLAKGDTVSYSDVEPNMKSALAFLNKMYKEGLIHKDSLVMKVDQVNEAYAKGKAGIAIANWTHRNTMLNSLKQKDLFKDAEWVAVGSIEGTDNFGVKGAKGYRGMVPINMVHAIPSTSKNAEAVMKMIAYMYSNEEMYRTITWGVPGVHHQYNDTEGVKFTSEGEELRKTSWITAYRSMETHGTNPALKAEKSVIEVKFGENAKYYYLADQQPLLNNILFGITTKEYLDFNNALQTRKNEVFNKILVGEAQASTFDEWVSFWKKNGGQQILDAGVAAYNKRFGKNYTAKKY